MIRVALIAQNVQRTLVRYLPEEAGSVWMGCHFAAFEPDEAFDWVVVLHKNLTEELTLTGDPDNVAYVSMEPRESPLVGSGYLEQFSRIAATAPQLSHPGLIRRTGMGWWVGMSVKHDGGHRVLPGVRFNYDDLARMDVPSKVARVSIVTSSARVAPGHIARDRLIARIMAHPIARHVDLYGGGRRPIDDKWDAIAPNAYHLALENSVIPGYWTEKLSDAFLGFALPLYFGCPNVADYFPADSVIPIDAFRSASAIEAIEQALDSDEWQRRLPAIIEARRRVLDEHNPLTIIAQMCDRAARRQERFELLPPSRFPVGPAARGWWRTKQRIYSRTRGISLCGRPLWRVMP